MVSHLIVWGGDWVGRIIMSSAHSSSPRGSDGAATRPRYYTTTDAMLKNPDYGQ